jgi:hypothetical protein
MITKNSQVWQYISHLFISIDQFGNALAGGNPDNTISARVGYYSHHYYETNKVPWYWLLFERIIDTAFYPVDGPAHCHEAYHNDAGEVFDNRVTNFMIAIAAAFVIIPSCVIIALVFYLLSALRIVKRKTIERDKNLVKRLKSATILLESAYQEIQEHGLDFELDDAKKQSKELVAVGVVIDSSINRNTAQ